jgi:hypothetical protein
MKRSINWTKILFHKGKDRPQIIKKILNILKNAGKDHSFIALYSDVVSYNKEFYLIKLKCVTCGMYVNLTLNKTITYKNYYKYYTKNSQVFDCDEFLIKDIIE